MTNLASLPEFLALQNASFDAVGIVDSQGHYVWVNDASIRLFGYAREESSAATSGRTSCRTTWRRTR